jgi:hypothetical protein
MFTLKRRGTQKKMQNIRKFFLKQGIRTNKKIKTKN